MATRVLIIRIPPNSVRGWSLNCRTGSGLFAGESPWLVNVLQAVFPLQRSIHADTSLVVVIAGENLHLIAANTGSAEGQRRNSATEQSAWKK